MESVYHGVPESPPTAVSQPAEEHHPDISGGSLISSPETSAAMANGLPLARPDMAYFKLISPDIYRVDQDGVEECKVWIIQERVERYLEEEKHTMEEGKFYMSSRS
ncbi:hypothetical protein J6590_007118 [Homalodisca vitripennis]|nr:hypothetical protein J6590_007118 [Homalodisca vitripennis]